MKEEGRSGAGGGGRTSVLEVHLDQKDTNDITTLKKTYNVPTVNI
jgi:hypothetical protein